MATHTYSDGTTTYYGEAQAGPSPRGGYGVGGQIFLWLAWAAAFAFWALTMSSFFGILSAINRTGSAGLEGGPEAGGAGLILLVAGLVIVGTAIAWGAARWATRDKRLDAMTEASTAALYDSVERAGGDDLVSRSPEARAPDERDSFRPA